MFPTSWRRFSSQVRYHISICNYSEIIYVRINVHWWKRYGQKRTTFHKLPYDDSADSWLQSNMLWFFIQLFSLHKFFDKKSNAENQCTKTTYWIQMIEMYTHENISIWTLIELLTFLNRGLCYYVCVGKPSRYRCDVELIEMEMS